MNFSEGMKFLPFLNELYLGGKIVFDLLGNEVSDDGCISLAKNLKYVAELEILDLSSKQFLSFL